MRVKHVGVAFSLVALLAVAAVVAGRVASVRADSLSVQIVEPGLLPANWGYDAASLTVHTGDTVTWTNTGNAPHTVAADDGSFDSGLMAGGDTWSFTPTSPGTYSYFCSFHPDMRGELVVTD